MIQFFKNLFNLNKIVKEQQTLIKELTKLETEVNKLRTKIYQLEETFNEIITK